MFVSDYRQVFYFIKFKPESSSFYLKTYILGYFLAPSQTFSHY